MLAILAPGQGAQKPGFLDPWLQDSRSATRLDWWSAVAGMDLAYYGTNADEEEIRDTAIAQPLLVAGGLLAAEALLDSGLDDVAVAAGHSVGELTIAAVAGVLSEEQALVLVRERGRAMAAAAALQPTSMTAVLRGDATEVLAAVEAAGLTAANHNGGGQIVAAGTVGQLAVLTEQPPAGSRLVPLSVAGAFHTEHMASAEQRLADLARGLIPRDPAVRLLSNADGAVLTAGAEVLTRIVTQVANPVRWDLCLASLAEFGVTGVLELPPAGTLTGLTKRNLKGVATFALNTPDQLTEAQAFVREHGAATR